MKKLFILITLAAFCFMPFLAFAGGEVVLTWEPNVESDLAGYRIYYKSGATNSPGGPPYSGDIMIEGPSPIDVPLSALDDVDNPEYASPRC